jgi:hypothetical protein
MSTYDASGQDVFPPGSTGGYAALLAKGWSEAAGMRGGS